MQVYPEGVRNMSLKELRIKKSLTQKEAAKFIGMPLRTYQNYENDENKISSLKYLYINEKLERYGFVDENNGILTLQEISERCETVFRQHKIEYAYLFGSYAKGKAHEKSDVDIVVSTSLSGLKFYGFVEELRTTLNKKVDVLTIEQLKNKDLLHEVLKYGVKIYPI